MVVKTIADSLAWIGSLFKFTDSQQWGAETIAKPRKRQIICRSCGSSKSRPSMAENNRHFSGAAINRDQLPKAALFANA